MFCYGSDDDSANPAGLPNSEEPQILILKSTDNFSPAMYCLKQVVCRLNLGINGMVLYVMKRDLIKK